MAKWGKDSVRVVKKLTHHWPVQTKRDYRRFYKLYADKDQFERLIKHQDSARIKSWMSHGQLTGRDLFDLTFNYLSDEDFNYALLYKIDFRNIKCKDGSWYLSQFGIIFNADGKAIKLFDHNARGYTLFDKRKRNSG